MIQIQIPKEIREYEPKFISIFTMRQAICVSLAACISVSLYVFVFSKILVSDMALFASAIPSIPLLLAGYFKMYGMPFEKFALQYVQDVMLSPKNRKYASQNFHEELAKKADKIKENGEEVYELNGNKKAKKVKEKKQTPVVVDVKNSKKMKKYLKKRNKNSKHKTYE